MGRKKLERSSIERLFSKVSTMLVPEHILVHFDTCAAYEVRSIWDAREFKTRWVIEMREKEGFIPKELHSQEREFGRKDER